MCNSLFDQQVPKIWASVGFLSMKPLGSWTQDLTDRIQFLQKWIDGGTPNVFWISGFFFPQAFITGTLQNYARKYVIAVDRIDFEVKVLDHMTQHEVKEKPENGCYIYGIFLEGARWDHKKHYINTPYPKELFSDLPLVHLQPIEDRKAPTEGVYNCPLYKVESRQGTLSTTGHSTNFVMFMELASKDVEDTWIRAGVAAFLSLRY
jgi:dynein heavy chain